MDARLSDLLNISNDCAAIALLSQDVSMTYADLHHEWRQHRDLILKLDLAGQKRIGILATSKKEAVVYIGGVILSESVFVPLDKDAPIQRNLKIIEATKLDAILVSTELLADYAPFLEHFQQISSAPTSILLRMQAPELEESIPNDLAYILNTSGSSGQPKGVMISHKNALSFIDWADRTFEFHSRDVFASIAPFHFDLSVFDLFLALKNRASLLLVEAEESRNPRMLARVLAKFQVSICYATPSLLTALVNHGKMEKYQYQALRLVFFAGEVFQLQALRKLQRQLTASRLFNLYGPTETNVVTWYEIPSIAESRIDPFPIGKDCGHVETRIKDDSDEGELLVSGAPVMSGYWQDPLQTSKIFEVDQEGRQWYKTGDIVRKNQEGDYLFLGRRDRMVKRRGYRIELDEIEKCLATHPEVEFGAVIAIEDNYGSIMIKAYYQLVDQGAHKKTKSSAILRTFLLSQLPIYMLPDKFEAVRSLPSTSTNKIDYQALSRMKNFQST